MEWSTYEMKLYSSIYICVKLIDHSEKFIEYPRLNPVMSLWLMVLYIKAISMGPIKVS